jgi:hypothetical protein
MHRSVFYVEKVRKIGNMELLHTGIIDRTYVKLIEYFSAIPFFLHVCVSMLIYKIIIHINLRFSNGDVFLLGYIGK